MDSRIWIITIGSSIFAFFGCGKYDKIETTRVRPPVQASLPESILSNGSFGLITAETDYSKTCQTDAAAGDACLGYSDGKRLRCIVKNRLFCKGPTEVLTLLNDLDAKLSYVEGQSEKGVVSCMNSTPIDLSTQITYPGSVQLIQAFQCQDPDQGLAFGEKNGHWYVRRSGGVGGQAWEISPEGIVHGFLWLASSDGSMSQSTGLLHIRADSKNKTIELTGGGVGFGFCGLHFQSNATYVYLKMNPDGVGSSCDYNRDNVTDSADWLGVCLDASTMDETDSTACSDLKKFSLATMGRDKSSNAAATNTWEAAAPLDTGSAVLFELRTYLSGLTTEAAKFEGVELFSAKQTGVIK